MIDIGQDIDLYKDEAVTITRRVKELRQITLSESEFSQSFSVPANAKNNNVFGYYGNLDVDDSVNPHKGFPARWSFDLAVRFVGVLELQGVVYKNGKPQSYNLVFYGRVKNLATIFGEDTLPEIDWGDYDHILTYDNVKDSWDGNLLSGNIVYPLVDFESNYYFGPPELDTSNLDVKNIRNENNGILLSDLKPAIKLRAMLKSIFSNYDLTLSGTIDDTRFDNLFVLPSKEAGIIKGVDDTNENAVSVSITPSQGVLAGASVPIEYDVEQQDLGNNFNTTTFTFTAPETAAYSISANYNFIAPPSTVVTVTVELTTTEGTFPLQQQTYTSTSFGSISDSILVPQAQLPSGATIRILIAPVGNNITVLSSSLFITSYFFGLFNKTIDLAITMPQDSVVDFVNQFLKSLRWVVIPGDQEGEWRVLSESEYKALGTTRDWSNYIDISNTTYKKPNVYKNIDIKFKDSEAAQQVQFKNNQNRNFGSVKIKPDVDFGQEQFTVESPFTLWNPSVFNVLNEFNQITGTSGITLYKMIDIEGSAVHDKYLLFYNQGEVGTSSVDYYIQTDIFLGQPSYEIESNYPICTFYDYDFATGSPVNTDLSASYAIEYPLFGDPPLETLYKAYWEEQLYQLYAGNSRIAIAEFYLPRDQFLTFEMNDRIFAEGRYWTIDQISYNTQKEVAKATLRSDKPIVDRPNIDGVTYGGEVSTDKPLSSFEKSLYNLREVNGSFYLGARQPSLLSNKITYTNADQKNINQYVQDIIKTANECILTWGED